MTSLPWITFETSPSGNIVSYHEPQLRPPLPEAHAAAENSCRPSFVTFVGRRSKTILLDRLLGGELVVPVHKEVYLWSLPRQGGCTPLIIIDCGMQNSQSQPPNPTTGGSATLITSWSLPDIHNVNATLCGRVFAPFSSVICCFVSDLGGPKAVANWLADLANAMAGQDLPTVPRILLVVETRSDTFDERIAANKATVHLQQALQTKDSIPENQRRYLSIGEIEVLGLQSCKSTSARARALKRRLLAMTEASSNERASDFTQFSYAHFQALTKQSLCHISTDIARPFHFASASRPQGFTTDLLEGCLSDFLNQMPSQAWLWHFAAPLIASALLLASYPPYAHDFAPDYLFDALYSTPCEAAIAAYTMHAEIQRKFVSAVLHEFRTIFKAYHSGTLSASELHREALQTNHPHFAELKSHRACFSCFLRMPEKVLGCGHALCDPCIRIFGNRCRSEIHTYELTECVLCGVIQRDCKFRFVPPTAGIRMLSVDGGGVRGVVPLVFLQHLDLALSPLGCAIKDHFDFVCGTSAGGLVVIGMFLLQWSATESIQRFEEVAAKTFGKQKALLSRALQLVVAYVEDGQYSLAAVQDAFKKTFNSPLQMFNPLRNDTKVAVTTTAVQDSLPWLFTNYNGGKRRADVGYDVVRAERAQNDITVSDAACCTSAAPWFFKPQAVRSLGIYQDGGLQHNNPASIAQWESRFLWPNKGNPDFALSLGTGSAAVSANMELTKSRFYTRLFKSFMRNLDGEDAWKRFYNSLDPNMRSRYHRLNVRFIGPEPSLDDALQIPMLKTVTLQKIHEDEATLASIVDAILASMFYFELDAMPMHNGNDYLCQGYIRCRLDLPVDGLRYLYGQLLDTSSWFLIQGSPVQCVQCIPKGLPPFKKRVTFRAESMNEAVAFSLGGIVSSPKPLSGFPTTLTRLSEEQSLVKPFGTIDHKMSEKPLPAIPAKRISTALLAPCVFDLKRPRVKTGFI